jgi:hypothetical protein
MDPSDHTLIRVGDYEVGLIGLKTALEEIAETHAEKTDEEISKALLGRIAKKNYIPSSARDAYGEALLREFRKFLGQPVTELDNGPLKVVVLGPSCSMCNSLEQTVLGVLSELDLPASLEHVTDIKEIARYGLTRLPALLVNGKALALGTVPTARKIKEWLVQANHGKE